MLNLDYKQKIIASRKGGLGGSDAAMVLKIGTKGIESLSESDKKRIAVLTGQIDYKPIPTNAAMQRGNDFESWVHEHIFSNYENNARIDLANNSYSFNVFAHADFIGGTLVYEAKCTNKNIDDTASDYIAQLQWYYMLGMTKVILVHCHSELDFTDYQFQDVEKNENIINTLKKGLDLINEFIKEFTYIEVEDWSDADLLPFEREKAELLYVCLKRIKDLENVIETQKETLKSIFESNNIKSLKSDNYTITYVGESLAYAFDKAKLLKDHPEINETDYMKKINKKSFLKFSIK